MFDSRRAYLKLLGAVGTVGTLGATAERLLGTARADTWPVYGSGDSDRDVVTIQYLLRAVGFSLSVDGVYGTETESAVESFQSAQGLSVDGVVGANTWDALTVTVSKGDRGSAVSAAQDQLANQWGDSLTVDGAFGPTTESAVESFQSSEGLAVDGIVGPNTWHALVADGSGSGGSDGSSGVRGTFTRPPSDLASMRAEIDELASEGVTDLFVETFFHGQTIYPSAHAPSKGYPTDFLTETIDYAHSKGLAVHAWIECTYWWNLQYLGPVPDGHLLDGTDTICEDGACYELDESLVTTDADGRLQAEGGKVFVSPFADSVVSTLADVAGEVSASYDVDGVMLDYVRFPKADPAYGYGLSSPYDGSQTVSEMQALREDAVADMVATVAYEVADDVTVSTAVFSSFYTSDSSAEYNKSQDWKHWRSSTSVDWFVPMCYGTSVASYDGDMAYADGIQTSDDRMLPALAITDGHDSIETQYDYWADYDFDGYLLWKASAIDGEVP